VQLPILVALGGYEPERTWLRAEEPHHRTVVRARTGGNAERGEEAS
jgi:hypothetical protein